MLSFKRGILELYHHYWQHSSFSVIHNFLPNHGRIDIQWVATTECQYWQDPAMIWQEITNCRKTQLSLKLLLPICLHIFAAH